MEQPGPQPAQTAEEAFWTLDPFEQVFPGHPFYANIERHFADEEYSLVRPLVRRLTPPRSHPGFKHVAVVGHRGAGKTTMVRSAMASLEEQGTHVAAYVDVVSTLDVSDFAFADVLITVVDAAMRALSASNAPLPADELRLFWAWFTEEERTTIRDSAIEGRVDAEVSMGGGVPYLARLTSRLTGQLRSNTQYRQQLRAKVERDPRELMSRANQVLDVASSALGRRLVIVFDNLEKVHDRAIVERAFLQRADEVHALRASMVLFLHASDQYAPSKIRASDAFETLIVPMLPIRKSSETYGTTSRPAVNAIRDVIGLRVNVPGVFETPTEAAQQITAHSGGRLRDAIELARLACELAGAKKVTTNHLERAARRMSGDRAGMLRSGDLSRLVDVSRRKRAPSDDGHGYLLLQSLVLQYNGQPWWDIHPLLLLDGEIGAAIEGVKQE